MILGALRKFRQDNGGIISAGLAFYAFISIIPLFSLIIFLSGVLLDQQTTLEFLGELSSSLGGEKERIILNILSESLISSEFSVLNLFLVILGATAFFGHLQKIVRRIWRESEKKSFIKSFLKKRLTSILIILSFVLILLGSISATLIVLPLFEFFLPAQILLIFFVLIALTIFLIFLYRSLLRNTPTINSLWKGALFTSFLMSLGQIALSIYLNNFISTGLSGSANALFALAVWLYYMSIVFVFGSELTYLYSTRA